MTLLNSTEIAPPLWHRLKRQITLNPQQLFAQVGAFVVCGVYGAWLLTSAHAPASLTSWQLEWLRHLATWMPVLPLLVRVHRQRHVRSAWFAMTLGVLLFNIASEVRRVDFPSFVHLMTPTLRDALYALSYLAIAVAVIIVMQRSFGPLANSVRFDGFIAGLALAAFASMYSLRSSFEISGRPLLAEFNVFNPILVIVLLVLLGAGLVPKHFRTDTTTAFLIVGLAAFLIGDMLQLNPQVFDQWASQVVIALSRPLGLCLFALAAWPRGDLAMSPRQVLVAPRGLNLIPVIFGVVSTGILALSMVQPVSESTRLMALASVSLVILRMVLTQNEVRQLGRSNFIEARTDHVTGLANRRAFLEDGEAKLSTLRSGNQLGIVLIDLDGFKEVNDSIGHAYGDELLRIIGQRFASCLDGRGTLARLGGDEFAYTFVVEAGVDPSTSARELALTLESPVALDGTKVRVSASIGVALWPQHGSTHAELLRSADVAMYEAKHRHSGVCIYRDEIDLNSRERLSMVSELRTVIERRRLTLHFQPTHDLRTNTVHGVEALVRWQHPTLGLLQPDSFIPLAERVGLIVPLTRTVIDLAACELARLDRSGHRLQMSVNISRWDLMDEQLAYTIDRILQWYGVSPKRITLEVTESSISQDPVRAKQSLDQLRSAGLKVSIDDFGVGYSSMSELLKLPVDELKIDKSFVQALDSDSRAIALIRSMIEMSRALDLDVIAEGIENAGNFEALRSVGVDIIQGDFFSQPLPSDQLDDFLTLAAGARVVNEAPPSTSEHARARRHLRVL